MFKACMSRFAKANSGLCKGRSERELTLKVDRKPQKICLVEPNSLLKGPGKHNSSKGVEKGVISSRNAKFCFAEFQDHPLRPSKVTRAQYCLSFPRRKEQTPEMSGAGSRQHSHDCSEHDCSAGWSLYKSIDQPHVRALNESVEGSAKDIFKPWESRLDTDKVLESQDDDPELLVFIPFTSDVKIRSICVIGGSEGSSPSSMRAYVNRDDLDFSTAADLAPVQEWGLAENLHGEIEYPTKFAKFQGVANLTLHFPSNFAGDGRTQISFIGLKGEVTGNNRNRVAHVVYEAMPNPKDHQVKEGSGMPQIL